MTDLVIHLERLGLEQYLDAFIGEGFDTWDILCDVQESDLEQLNVKLGHRRKLQRAIADYRGISYERLVGSPAAQDAPSDPTRTSEISQSTPTGREVIQSQPTETKRKYRRHPKSDDNAPEKPPSAYVLFSNKVREEVKAENLSFTSIAKLVGERWQNLEPAHKEPFESQATSLKNQYNVKLSAYKKTDSYKEYAQYLSDFKAKHGVQTETKRPKLDPQSSGGSLSANSIDLPDGLPLAAGHGRVGSVSSLSAASLTSAMTSPPIVPHAPIPAMPNTISIAGARAMSSLVRPHSPPSAQTRLLRTRLSSQSSTSDESGQLPYDSLSRTATLSLSTPPTGTPPLPGHALGSARPEQAGPVEGYTWSSRSAPQGSLTPSAPSPLGSGITLPSPTFPGDPRRDRGMDWARQVSMSVPASAGGQGPALPLPPLLGSDRLAELTHNQIQRTLPPLRQNAPPMPTPTAYQGTNPAGQLSRQGTDGSERGYSHTHDGGGRVLNRNENEAANALAGLAARPAQETPLSRSHDRHRP